MMSYPFTEEQFVVSRRCTIDNFRCVAGIYPNDIARAIEEFQSVIREADRAIREYIVSAGGVPLDVQAASEVFVGSLLTALESIPMEEVFRHG